MKDIINIIIIVLALSILLPTSSISQDNSCALQSNASSTTPYKPTKTPNQLEYLNCLIVYVTFPDDNYPPLYDNFWPAHTRPVNIDGNPLVWQTERDPGLPFMDRYPRYTISDYFCEMSMGQLDVVGDEVYIEMPQSSTYYRDQGYDYGSLNRLILQLVDQQFQWVDFRNYDRWRFNTTSQQWEQIQDDIVDMVIMDYRYIPSDGNPTYWFFGSAASGEASLGGYSSFGTLVLDGKNLNSSFNHYGSGCTCIGQRLKYSAVAGIIEHEISHSFLVDNLNGYDTKHSWIGLMTGVNSTCYNLSPFERTRSITGWNINPILVNPAMGTQEFTLGDFIATGDMLRISILNTSESFWVANHQKVSLYDGISRGSKQCYDINGGGQDPYCDYG